MAHEEIKHNLSQRTCKENVPLLVHQTLKQRIMSSAEDGSSISREKWPHFVWFIMKISALFYHDKIVTERKCLSCEAEYLERLRGGTKMNSGSKAEVSHAEECLDVTMCYEYSTIDMAVKSIGSTSSHQERHCKACETCWWDRYGRIVRYTEESIGLKQWNHRGSWLVSVFILATVVSLLLFIVHFVIEKVFARKGYLLSFMTYTAFLCPLTVFPIMNVCSKLRSAFSGQRIGSWATTMNARYIVQRLQFLDLSKQGLPAKFFLIICLLWPIYCSSYRAIILVALKCHHDVEDQLLCLTVFITEIIWGCFMYLLYLIRTSFQIQSCLVLDFIKEYEGHAELCHSVIRRMVVDFKCFRRCVTLYLAVMIPICALGASTSLTWQYTLPTRFPRGRYFCGHRDAGDKVFHHTNVMIWSEVTMFFVLGPVAFGGFDVTYIWDNFQIHTIFMQDKKFRKFWNEMIRVLEDYEIHAIPSISFPWVLSMVSLYMALHFDMLTPAHLAKE
ncbi:hypothetical protein HOLleu_18428 [Holothuria leucospilota]|uniref:Uncharacterized protein n=1 Tax=Holothuria leucospilota TaxID=206669 RepID=A0A9Q1C3T2_HOLLE|nr:hypothetical protein HOLleu_18428 [Holothuria leucospilota]